jgi:ligand-binding sensor domain-containing protein
MNKLSLSLLSLFLFYFYLGFAQTKEKIKFHRLPAGISNNHVEAIFQDRSGFMWFGTASGLNKFDGYGYTIYQNDPLAVNSITRSLIYNIFEDSSGNLWIGTENAGLNYFDPKSNKFKRYSQGTDNQHISYNMTRDIIEDKNGLIWLAVGNGLNCYNPQSGKFSHYTALQKETNFQGSNIFSIVEDEENNIWVGGYGGISRFDKKTKKYTNFNPQNSPLKGNLIRVILKSKQKNKFWIGFEDAGLSLVHIQNGKISLEKHYAYDTKNPQGLAGNFVLSLCEDRQNRLWIGVENEGINILNPQTGEMQLFANDSNDELSLANNSPNKIYEDRWGNIWIGTYNQGVNVVYNQYFEKFAHYRQKTNGINGLVNNNVSGFWEDKSGKIWIATDGGGLSYWNRENDSFENFTREKSPPRQITSNAVLALTEDAKNQIWMGTWEGAYNIYNPDNQSFKFLKTAKNGEMSSHRSFAKNQKYLFSAVWEGGLEVFDIQTQKLLWQRSFSTYDFNYVYVLLADTKGNLWIGGSEGLLLLSSQNITPDGTAIVFRNIPKNSQSLSDNLITEIFEDSKGNIWVGTSAGLNKYNPKQQNFSFISKKDGLVNEFVKGIIEDEEGYLWITTAKGLSKYNPQTSKFENYTQADGLQGDEFTQRAIYRAKSGEILIGGTNGFNIFQSKKLVKNPYEPKVFFQGFKLFNKAVLVGKKNSPLAQPINYTSEITLDYTQSVFTIEYVALNYIRPEKNQYAYMLEGFEKDWNYVGNKREATYTSLPAGEYTFKVKAANNDEVWSKQATTLKIIVLPPWWETWWFRTLVISLIVVIVGFGVWWRFKAIEAQKKRLESLVEKRTAELKEKNDEVLTQSEELFQQAEELKTQRDYIQGQNMQLAEQNKIMEEKSRQIRQSINAAQTIQQAILPHQEKLTRLLGEHFVFYQPKDVVSGDFYWLSQIEDQTILVIADCTGHGVPGAFMTLIGNSILDKLVKVLKITNPAEILTQLHREIYDKLNQDVSGNSYGMDAIVLNITSLANGEKKIAFSGAKTSLYYFSNHPENKVQELKGSRKSIGGLQNDEIIFENKVVSLSQGSMIYVGSDGYIDQNNVKRKRLGNERFIQLIQEFAPLSIEEQASFFKQALDKYMQDSFQRDDILLIGIKI